MKRLVALALGLLLVITGCGTEVAIQEVSNPSSEELLDLIMGANEIQIDKALISIVAHYDVSVENQKVGTITGEFVRFTGDVFTFKDVNGTVIGSEKQIKRWGVKLNRLAEVFDEDGNTVGYIGEEIFRDFFRYGYIFHFYDADKNEVAYTREVIFSLLSEYKIYDTSDNLICTVNENFSFTNQYIISIEDCNTVPVEQLIYFTCIVDAIKTAGMEESDD